MRAPTSPRWRPRAAATLALLLACLTVPAGGEVGAQAGCGQPFPPLFAVTYGLYSHQPEQVYPETPRELPSIDGRDLSFSNREPDSDDDGVADVIDVTASTMTVRRSDGEITIEAPAGDGISPIASDLSPVGDLDGDGRDEIQLLTRDGSGTDTYWVLPGATAPGTHPVSTAAIQVPVQIVAGIGDREGGPGGEILVPSSSGTSGYVASGDEVMAVGAGGTLDSFTPLSEPITDFVIGLVRLDDGPAQLLLMDASTPATVTLRDGGDVTRFRADGSSGISLAVGPRATVVDTGAARYLIVGVTTRSGTTRVVWDLDDPCRELPADAGGTTSGPPGHGTGEAPGASPRPGTATYTG